MGALFNMSAPMDSSIYFTKMSVIGRSGCCFHALFCILLSFHVAHLQAEKDFYSLSAVDIYGKEVSFEKFRGKPTLVVNVASACGYTNQHYSELAWIYDHSDFKGKFNILAFPCNQFGQQERGTPEAIEEFVRTVFQGTFPLFNKIDTIGQNVHPVYKFLAESTGKEPTWNFWKYLVDGDGKVLHAWGPKITVLDIYNQLYNIVRKTEKEKEAKRKTEKKKSDKDNEKDNRVDEHLSAEANKEEVKEEL